jgi:hypothetical protein
LQARDSCIFEDLKCLFSTTPEVGEDTEANGGHRGDRTLNRTWSRFDQTCPVSSTRQLGARVLGFATGAFGPSRNRSVRSGTQRSSAWRRANRTRGASSHMRSDASGRKRSSLEPLWTTTGRWHCHVRSLHVRVRSLAGSSRLVRRLEGTADRKVDRTRCASGHDRPDASGRDGTLLDSNRTPSVARPVG